MRRFRRSCADRSRLRAAGTSSGRIGYGPLPRIRAQLSAFLKTHAPAGFAESAVGSSSSPTEHAQDVIQQLRIVPENVSEAGLEIGVEADPAGGSLVNVYGGVQWTEPRPADEFVPAHDHAVVISVIRVFQPGKPIARRVVVTDPAKVSAIAQTFDVLSVAPPGLVFNCYMLSSSAVSYRIAFATSSTAKPDLVATAAPCSVTVVTVDGQREAGAQRLVGSVRDRGRAFTRPGHAQVRVTPAAVR